MPRRTNAFTLQELLIVMILSGILLSTSYYGLRIVQQYYRSFDLRHTRNVACQTLQHLLQQDIDQATYVTKENDAIVCHYDRHTVVYQFAGQAVVRKQAGLTEAFPGPAQNVRYFFQNQAVTLNRQPIDELAFSVLIDDEQLAFRAHKTYAADQLIQLTSESWPD